MPNIVVQLKTKETSAIEHIIAEHRKIDPKDVKILEVKIDENHVLRRIVDLKEIFVTTELTIGNSTVVAEFKLVPNVEAKTFAVTQLPRKIGKKSDAIK